MGRRTGTHAVVTPHALVEVDEHRLGAVDKAFVDSPLEQRVIGQCSGLGITQAPGRRLHFREHVLGEHVVGDAQYMQVAKRGERRLEWHFNPALPRGIEFIEPEQVPPRR